MYACQKAPQNVATAAPLLIGPKSRCCEEVITDRLGETCLHVGWVKPMPPGGSEFAWVSSPSTDPKFGLARMGCHSGIARTSPLTPTQRRVQYLCTLWAFLWLEGVPKAARGRSFASSSGRPVRHVG